MEDPRPIMTNTLEIEDNPSDGTLRASAMPEANVAATFVNSVPCVGVLTATKQIEND